MEHVSLNKSTRGGLMKRQEVTSVAAVEAATEADNYNYNYNDNDNNA